MPRVRRLQVALLAVAPVVLASCYSFATPSYHPGEARDLLTAIARQGVTVAAAIPGESACDDGGLVANALHLAVTDPADDSERDVWIYTFRERYWDASESQVDACQAAFEAAHPGVTVTRVDTPLYRSFGADWSSDLARAVEAGLAEGAEAGAP